MVRDTAWNLQSTLGQSARNVTVPGLLCQPCAGESCIGPERGCVSVLFSIYGSEPQSGSKRSVHPPPGRALTHQAADSGGPGGATLQPAPSAFPSLPRTQESGDCPGVPQSSSEAPLPLTETVSLAESLIQLKPKQLKKDAGLADYQRELARPPQTQDWVHGPTLCHSYFPVQYRRDWPLGRRESSALGLRDQGMNFWASLEFSHHGPLRPAAAMP